MNQITLRAAAKLNFTLDITGTRPDGYHRLPTVMQSVSVYDTLALQKAPEISLQAVELATPQNLAWEAAADFPRFPGVHERQNIFSHSHIKPLALILWEMLAPSDPLLRHNFLERPKYLPSLR